MKIALALIAVLGVFIGATWWDDTYAAPARLERRYLEAQQSIETAHADLFRAQQECRALAIEFGSDSKLVEICVEGLPHGLEMARVITDGAQKTMRALEQKHCPGESWCPQVNETRPWDTDWSRK